MITPIEPISSGPGGGVGPAGPQGPAGQSAVQPTFSVGTVASGATPAVTITGSQTSPVLNFTLKPGDAGSTGPSGQSGTNGANGTNAVQPTFTIGTVAAGASPAVSLTGTQTAPVLNFTLKSGDAGSTGAVGPAGTNAVQPAFSIGSVTSNATPAVTLTGTQTAPVLNFALKPGTDGAIGPTGLQGQAGKSIYAGSGAPAIAGLIGELYVDSASGDLYQLS